MPKLQIPKKLEPFLTKSKRYKIAYGGRGAAKSVSIADMLLFEAQVKGLKIGCFREVQNTIDDSVHALLKTEIGRVGFEGFTIQDTRIFHHDGGEFKFRGLSRNPDGVKSMHGFRRFWVEEAQSISEESLQTLTPTLREAGSEVWMSLNPGSSKDPISKRFIEPFRAELERDGYYEDELHLIIKVNYYDNPWFPESLEMDRQWAYDNLSRAEYDHIWLGAYNDTIEDAIIKPEWFDAAIDAHKKLGFEPEGVRSMGFDPADGGKDYKAIAFRHGVVVLNLDQWKEGDVDDATAKAYALAHDLRCTDFVYDAIGIGTAVKTSMKSKDPRDQIAITGFVGSESPRNSHDAYMEDRINKDVFGNLRAQWYWYLRDRFENTYKAVVKKQYIDPDKLISISSDCQYLQQLRAEICRIPRKTGAQNTKIMIASKAEMKSMKLDSPNLADALMYSFANEPPKVYNYAEDDETPYYHGNGWMA